MKYRSVNWCRCVGLLLLGMISATPLHAEETAASKPAEPVIQVLPSSSLPFFENRRAADEAVERKLLETRLDFKVEEMPIEEVFSQLAERLPVEIVIDYLSLEKFDTDLKTLVTIELTGVRADTVLELILQQIWLDHMVVRGQVVITSYENTKEGAGMVARFYNQKDLIDDCKIFHGDMYIDMLEDAIDPTTWESLGGAGYVAPQDKGLWIRQDLATHREIKQLNRAIRESHKMPEDAYDVRPRVVVDDPEMYSGMMEKLQSKRWTGNADAQTPEQFLRKLARETDLNLVFIDEHQDLEEVKIRRRWNDRLLIDLLADICEDLELEWSIVDNVIRLEYEGVDDHLLTKVYPIRDLLHSAYDNPNDSGCNGKGSLPFLQQPRRGGSGCLDLSDESPFDVLEGILEGVVPPTLWASLGGPGVLSKEYMSDCLVIRQTERIHQEVERVLGEYREKRPTPVIKEDKEGNKPDQLTLLTYFALWRDPEAKTMMIDAEELARICQRMQSVVRPNQWEEEGVFLEVLSDRVLIRQRQSVHREILQFFNETGLITPDDGSGFYYEPPEYLIRRLNKDED